MTKQKQDNTNSKGQIQVCNHVNCSCEYLVSTGQSQSVKDWYEYMSWNEKTQEIGASQKPVLCPKCVHLRWSTQDGHS